MSKPNTLFITQKNLCFSGLTSGLMPLRILLTSVFNNSKRSAKNVLQMAGNVTLLSSYLAFDAPKIILIGKKEEKSNLGSVIGFMGNYLVVSI